MISDDAGAHGHIINTEDYKNKMEEVLLKYGLAPENLQFVDRFENDTNPLRVAKCLNILKRIIFKKTISEDERQGVISALYRFEDKQLNLLKDDWAFIKHTLLHEICRIIARWRNDYECDKWAFYELKD